MNWRYFFSHFLRSRRFSLPAIALGLLLLLSAYAPLQPDQAVAQPNIAPTPAPTSVRDPTATPPTQGGHGHDLFYIYCMSCHGDQGQGLTDEFRYRVYPPEDTNCWKSGCHGSRPYDDGFTLPQTVPALIGEGTLQHFDTAQNMYDFMRRAMPFNKPGSLSDEQYLQVLAFLLESNHLVPVGTRLDATSLASIVIHHSAPATPTFNAPSQSPAADATLAGGGGAIML
ncbi:MAG TPA: c-type cytochrome, partial [Anaerolineae bacterium]|nr:c-type cytochrome [Anaerolineae bacterium]